jgi:Methyltransferase domain
MTHYLRIRLFQNILRRYQPGARRRRMRQMMAIFSLPAGSKIIDLGGVSGIWNTVEVPLDVTIVNLPGVYREEDIISHHHFTYLEGDATCLSSLGDNSFGLVFSNSVIEHVGGSEKQRLFATEVRRLAPSYYVQTPSIWFPLEAHTGIPFWWFLPSWIRERLHRRWAKTLPAWNEMILGTTVLRKRTLQGLFPDASLLTERKLLLPKSYCAYRNAAWKNGQLGGEMALKIPELTRYTAQSHRN